MWLADSRLYSLNSGAVVALHADFVFIIRILLPCTIISDSIPFSKIPLESFYIPVHTIDVLTICVMLERMQQLLLFSACFLTACLLFGEREAQSIESLSEGER